MTTLGDARMPTLKDKIENQALKEAVVEKKVKTKKLVVGAAKRVKTKVKSL